jgi:hypothetical protein
VTETASLTTSSTASPAGSTTDARNVRVQPSSAGKARRTYGPRRVWTQEQIAGLVAGRRAGLTYRVLGAELGMPPSTVRQKLARLGYSVARVQPAVPQGLGLGGGSASDVDASVAARIVLAYTERSEPFTTIAAATGIPVPAVRRVLLAAGVQLRARNGTPQRAWNDDTLVDMAARYTAGESIARIAADLAVPYTTVVQKLHDLGARPGVQLPAVGAGRG